MDQEQSMIIDWRDLPSDECVERIEWCRSNLSAPEDWGYCEEFKTLVLKNTSSVLQYKMCWFDAPNVERIIGSTPKWVTSMNLTEKD